MSFKKHSFRSHCRVCKENAQIRTECLHPIKVHERLWEQCEHLPQIQYSGQTTQHRASPHCTISFILQHVFGRTTKPVQSMTVTKKSKKQHGQHMIHVELNLSGIFSGSLCCRNTFPCSNKCSLNATFIFPCRRLQIIKRRLKCAGCSVSEGIKQTHRSIFDSVENVHSITCQPSPRSITLGFFLSTLVSYLFG